jgi:hypothetical protein
MPSPIPWTSAAERCSIMHNDKQLQQYQVQYSIDGQSYEVTNHKLIFPRPRRRPALRILLVWASIACSMARSYLGACCLSGTICCFYC